MARKKKGRPVSGWLVLDKPYELGSTQAVGKIRWLFQAKKAGHAGTLDPLATGVLPIALGEATKTMPYVTEGEKAYRFTASWGAETSTDDLEGEVVETSDKRPSREEIEALLPEFTGEIEQIPPAFSAVKIGGERAYDIARAGDQADLKARTVQIDRFEIVDMPDTNTTIFDVECGKGTYVRALARDMGRKLCCFGHVRELRRTLVHPFEEEDAIPLDTFAALEGDLDALDAYLIEPLAAMAGFEQVAISSEDARRIRLGNAILLRGRDAPIEGDDVCAVAKGELVAIGRIEKGQFHPRRVLLPG